MKLLFDLFPVILFFIAYKLFGIYAATLVAIIAAALQVAWMRLRHGRTERVHLVTLGLLVLFGGMTLAFKDPTFVMWKPTIVNWLFALVFLGTQFIGEKPLAQRMMGQAVDAPDPIWRRLNLSWVAFFFLSGLVNLYVVYVGSGFYEAKQALIAATGTSAMDLSHCASLFSGNVLALCERAHHSESTWVDFKLFGMMGMTMVFVLAQGLYLARHIRDYDTNPAQPQQGAAPAAAAGQADAGSQ
ncbi:septation protein A [Thiohalocapsa sp. ML1]|uniref:septation protein A n=1 Tax=Thiohalocapsa sp. ML1 TaxID=1431688 RepID=UPI0009EBCC38|nr:septation protein A [Thiohalocapsa sp. ML1]